jgi:hypothetical protein
MEWSEFAPMSESMIAAKSRSASSEKCSGLDCLVRRLVDEIKLAVLERINHRRGPGMKRGAAKIIESLVVRRRAHPRFAHEENLLLLLHG